MSTSSILSLPTGYYSNLLTHEYKDSQKFIDWLTAFLQIADDVSQCLLSMLTAFDLDYAVGDQLDMIGQLVGISRTVPFQPSLGTSPILDDDTYRLLISATIANNTWNGTIADLYPIWNKLFPGGRISIFDHQDMTATIVLTGSFSSIIKDLIEHEMIVPRPQAVQYTYSFNGLPFFGFNRSDTFVSGFNTGKWS
jgi:hypothetical protein